jgi:hypothetical protein
VNRPGFPTVFSLVSSGQHGSPAKRRSRDANWTNAYTSTSPSLQIPIIMLSAPPPLLTQLGANAPKHQPEIGTHSLCKQYVALPNGSLWHLTAQTVNTPKQHSRSPHKSTRQRGKPSRITREGFLSLGS